MSDKIVSQPIILERSNGLYVSKDGNNVYTRLTNFHCRIVKETIIEGVKTTSHFTIWLGIPIPSATKPEEDFQYSSEEFIEVAGTVFHSGDWLKTLGSQYVTYPMRGKSEYIGIAASTLYPFKPKEIVKVCSVIGFKELPNGNLVYVSGNSILGDNSGIEAKPLDNGKISKYGLKQTNTYSIYQSFTNSTEFLDLGDARITVPLWLAAYRSPLCYFRPFPGIIKLVGQTGTFKSSIAAKVMSHFGSFNDNKDHVLKWNHTTTALQIELHHLRDTLVIIDDFNPEASKTTRDLMMNNLSIVLGDSSDGASKARATAELKLSTTFINRCVVVSTAEIIPNLPESRLARMMVIDMNRVRSIDKEKLYAYNPKPNTVIMADYIEWIRKQDKQTFINYLQTKYDYFYEKVSREAKLVYARTAELYAELMLGFITFERYLKETHKIDFNKDTWCIIHEAMIQISLDQNPIGNNLLEERKLTYLDQFIEAIRESLCSNQAHILGLSKAQATIGNDRKTFLGFYDEKFIYLSFFRAIRHVNLERLNLGLPEIPTRVLASELKSERGLDVSKVRRLNKETTIRCLQLEYNEVFGLES